MQNKIQELNELLRASEERLQQEVERRKAAEKTLEEFTEKLKRAFKEMPVIIYATDEDGSVIFFNREFERVSGYSTQDIADNPEMINLLFPKDQLNTQREWSFQSKDGSEKVVLWSNISTHFSVLGWKSWKVGIDVTELKTALTKVKTLSGLLPICANCKNIRDDKGYWSQIEVYIRDHSEAEFSHSICPECAKELYPDLDI